MIGTPPSQRLLWHDPAVHARDFAERYAERMDYLTAQRMMELGIPNHQIGRPDPDHEGRWRAFFPHEGDGGGVVGNQINADAGLFDTDLMTRRYGTKIGKLWEKDRLRDRLDQIIAHEHAEAKRLAPRGSSSAGGRNTPGDPREGSGKAPGDCGGREAWQGPLKLVPPFPSLVCNPKDAVISLGKCSDGDHDSDACQLAVSRTIAIGHLAVARQISGERSSGRS